MMMGARNFRELCQIVGTIIKPSHPPSWPAGPWMSSLWASGSQCCQAVC